jgi:DNA-binding NarL/FixJ family response regulator
VSADVTPMSVVLVEDHQMIAESMRMAIEQSGGMRVAGVGRTLAEGAQLVRSERPDVAVLDFRLPDGEASQVIAEYLTIHPPLRVMIVSATADSRSVVGALEAGASGYMLKDQTLEELIAAIRLVASGGQALAPALVPLLVAQIAQPPATSQRLSPREIEVLQLLAEGMSTTDLSKRLHVSVNTVRNHVQNVISRLGAHSKLEAVSIALRDGLIEPPQSSRR